MDPYWLEDDCEDQQIVATDRCTQWPCCTRGSEAILRKNARGFWACPLCDASYGDAPADTEEARDE